MCFHIADEELYQTRSGAVVWVEERNGRATFEVVQSDIPEEVGMTGDYASDMGHVLCANEWGPCKLHRFDAVRFVPRASPVKRSPAMVPAHIRVPTPISWGETSISPILWVVASTSVSPSPNWIAEPNSIIDAGWPPKVAAERDERLRNAVPI
jgi:hypothetical protein